jgi:hypothetical protein
MSKHGVSPREGLVTTDTKHDDQLSKGVIVKYVQWIFAIGKYVKLLHRSRILFDFFLSSSPFTRNKVNKRQYSSLSLTYLRRRKFTRDRYFTFDNWSSCFAKRGNAHFWRLRSSPSWPHWREGSTCAVILWIIPTSGIRTFPFSNRWVSWTKMLSTSLSRTWSITEWVVA